MLILALRTKILIGYVVASALLLAVGTLGTYGSHMVQFEYEQIADIRYPQFMNLAEMDQLQSDAAANITMLSARTAGSEIWKTYESVRRKPSMISSMSLRFMSRRA